MDLLAEAVRSEVFPGPVEEDIVARISGMFQRLDEYVLDFNDDIVEFNIDEIRLLNGNDGKVFVLSDIDVAVFYDEPRAVPLKGEPVVFPRLVCFAGRADIRLNKRHVAVGERGKLFKTGHASIGGF